MKKMNLAICLLSLTALSGLLEAKVLDRTIATVNADAIMLSEYEKNAAPILEQFKKSAPPADQTPEHVADIKKRVLDQMIDDRLLIEEAKKKNIHVSQLEVDEGVKKVRSRFATEEEFKSELDKEGMSTEDFRKHIQEQLATIKLIDQEVKAKTPPPTDDEIKDLYDTLNAIILDKPIPGSHTPSELEELKSLAKAVARRFDERARARHILIRVPPNASKEERDDAMKKIKDIQARLKKGKILQSLPGNTPKTPAPKTAAGIWDIFSRGDMVPAFDQAAFALDVGQTSDIVTTDFGYHIIQLEEKKAATKMSMDEIKDDLRDYLFQQRGAKRFETYVKDLRSKADIKINSLD